MDKLLIILVLYYVISVVIAMGFVIELVIINHSNKEFPVLKKDVVKTNIKVFALGLWLPLILYKWCYNFING